MSGKKEKELRRALKVIHALNKRGITSRKRAALEIATAEKARREAIAERKGAQP